MARNAEVEHPAFSGLKRFHGVANLIESPSALSGRPALPCRLKATTHRRSSANVTDCFAALCQGTTFSRADKRVNFLILSRLQPATQRVSLASGGEVLQESQGPGDAGRRVTAGRRTPDFPFARSGPNFISIVKDRPDVAHWASPSVFRTNKKATTAKKLGCGFANSRVSQRRIAPSRNIAERF